MMNWSNRWKRRKNNANANPNPNDSQGSILRRTTQTQKPPAIYLSLWENWSTKSDEDLPHVDWAAVLQAVQQDPSVAQYSDEDRRGMVLLHFVCALHPSLPVVDAVLQAHPQAVWKASRNAGITPLMIACGRNAANEVIRRLLQNARKTIQVTDASGYSAIHWACRDDVSAPIVRQLLICDPGVANHRVQSGRQSRVNGVTPIDILCQSKSTKNFSTNQGKKLDLLLWASYYGTIISRNGRVNSTLHAALALKCSEEVIHYAFERDAYFVAGVRDRYGNLPLHYAVQLPVASVSDSCILVQLIHAFPEGASCKDASGRLPLHMALKEGYTWSQGVRYIFEQYKLAIAIQEEEHELYPFALAAAFSDEETTYCLLREHPQFLAGV
jgi:ankyrin repeat protein